MRIYFLRSYIDNLSMAETLNTISASIESQKSIHHVVVNAAKMVAMQNDDQLAASVNSADIINADGQAVVWASKFLGKPLKERVAGIDLMHNLVDLAAKKGYSIFLFGAKEDVVSTVANIYRAKHGEAIIAGYRNGYFKKSEERSIAEQVAKSGAQILFVAISSPIKENFLSENKDLLSKVNFTMGVGGSFDVVAGKVKRAPLWMQNNGLEWLYRVIQEPKRMWKRYLIGNSKFIYLVFKERFKG